jgi:hypothetical protein
VIGSNALRRPRPRWVSDASELTTARTSGIRIVGAYQPPLTLGFRMLILGLVGLEVQRPGPETERQAS